MKFVSWNVNGLRACLKKGFMEYFRQADADVFCLQETKLQEGQVELDLKGYLQYWNYAEKKGYSGTALFTRREPLNVHFGFPNGEPDTEGRLITAEFHDFFLVNCYTPNSRRDLSRLDYRMEWEERIRKYLMDLDQKKPVIYCGDLNVSHKEIDLKNAAANVGNSGFTDEEREKMTRLLESGFMDTYRYFYPDREGAYTWWSYMNKARERNIGWRIDYFIVSERLKTRLTGAEIHAEVPGSDHCPIALLTDL
jgi:exodeoxyribonuclease III